MMKINKKIIQYLLLVIFAIIFFILIKRYNSSENKKIFANGKYTIGNLTYFSRAKNPIGVPNFVYEPGKPAEIRYTYEINGIKFENKYVEGIYKIPFSGPLPGEKYLVIYFKTDPQLSRMLFDYPIKDSTDFIRYLGKFKKNPPKMREK